jgi:hypothetical protein
MLNPVRYEDVKALWPWLEKGLTEMCANLKNGTTVEDIREMIVQRRADVFTIGHDIGFMVLQRLPTRTGFALHVAALWGPGERTPELQQQLYDDLNEIAKRAGCSKIRSSGRGGWAKRGFKVVDIILEREVW